MRNNEFSAAVIEKIGYYVYLLIDPQSDQIFYVGKGTGNRVFMHLNEALLDETENTKLDRIRLIRQRNQDVRHIIHRHGLTEEEAFHVEAALIDLLGLDQLTNAVSGHHSYNFGPMTINEIVSTYEAPAIVIKEPCIFAIINRLYQRGMSADDLYEATRGNWVIGERRNKAKYVFAVSNGVVRQVYEVERWYPVERPEYKRSNRWRFDGKVAAEMEQKYVGGSVINYLTNGAQNPIKYVNC
jgi:hypothetical protein